MNYSESFLFLLVPAAPKHSINDISCIYFTFKTNQAYYPDIFLPGRAVDMPVSSCNKAKIPESARFPIRVPRF